MNARQFLARWRKDHPALTQSLWLSSLFVLVVIIVLLFAPIASAGPITVDDRFDFTTGSQNWTRTAVGTPSADGKQWTYANAQWSVNFSPVFAVDFATGNYLTSPAINMTAQAIQAGGSGLIDSLRISLAHKFNFGTSTNGVPPAAGQIAISINGSGFVGLNTWAFHTGTLGPDSPFGPTPLTPYVTQTALVAPTYVPPSGGYSNLFPLINGGPAFTGSTANYSNTDGVWVPTVATISFAPQQITNLQIRLINANLGSSCDNGGWDVRFVQIDAAAPEPGSLLLAAMGGLLVTGRWLVRRRRPINTSPRAQA